MFITEEEFAKFDYKTVDMILERLHNKTIEDTLKLLPDIIIGLIVKTKGINQTLEAFKTANPALAGREQELIQVMQDIELTNGALSLDEILKIVPAHMKNLQLDVPINQPHNIDEVERTANGFI